MSRGKPDLIIAGAGMAGLVCAAAARDAGARVIVLEKASHAGGSMLLSSGVIWRYREWDEFRRQCPRGVPELQRRVFDRLDADLTWLVSLGVPVAESSTGNPLTKGLRFDPRAIRDVLVSRLDAVRVNEALDQLPENTPIVLATGGFQASPCLVERYITPQSGHVVLRAGPSSTGDGLRIGLDSGGSVSAGMDEFYGCALPAPPAEVGPDSFVRLVQRYAKHARVENALGERFLAKSWSEIEVVRWMATQPRARAWLAVPDEALACRVRERTVAEIIDGARTAGGPVTRTGCSTRVEVVASITTTLGGLAIDEHGVVVPGVFACGADAGGISTGGYSSGLAAALVYGRIAARAALGLSHD